MAEKPTRRMGTFLIPAGLFIGLDWACCQQGCTGVLIGLGVGFLGRL